MVTPTKLYETGSLYHVFNRGNRHQPLFYDGHDYRRFLKRFREYREEHTLTVLSYTLMPNHFHFLVRQDEDQALSKLFTRLSTSHAKFINAKYTLDGSLFQQGFHAKHIQDLSHLFHLFRYIQTNAFDLLPETLRVTAEAILRSLVEYPWSSLAEFLDPTMVKDPFCDRSLMLEMLGVKPQAIRSFLLDEIRMRQQKLSSETLRVTG